MKIKKRTVTIIETHSVTRSGVAVAPALEKQNEPEFSEGELAASSSGETGGEKQDADQTSQETTLSKKLRRIVRPFRRQQ